MLKTTVVLRKDPGRNATLASKIQYHTGFVQMESIQIEPEPYRGFAAAVRSNSVVAHFKVRAPSPPALYQEAVVIPKGRMRPCNKSKGDTSSVTNAEKTAMHMFFHAIRRPSRTRTQPPRIKSPSSRSISRGSRVLSTPPRTTENGATSTGSVISVPQAVYSVHDASELSGNESDSKHIVPRDARECALTEPDFHVRRAAQ